LTTIFSEAFGKINVVLGGGGGEGGTARGRAASEKKKGVNSACGA